MQISLRAAEEGAGGKAEGRQKFFNALFAVWEWKRRKIFDRTGFFLFLGWPKCFSQ